MATRETRPLKGIVAVKAVDDEGKEITIPYENLQVFYDHVNIAHTNLTFQYIHVTEPEKRK